MSTTHVVNGSTYHLTSNFHERDLLGWFELTPEQRADVDYVDYAEADSDGYTPRFFTYRGSTYDVREFTVAGDGVKALGFDAVQASSYWDAIVIRYFDREGYALEGIVVGHLHW